jgi:hypothetical protein
VARKRERESTFIPVKERVRERWKNRALTHFKDLSLSYVHDFIVCQLYREAGQYFCISYISLLQAIFWPVYEFYAYSLVCIKAETLFFLLTPVFSNEHFSEGPFLSFTLIKLTCLLKYKIIINKIKLTCLKN